MNTGEKIVAKGKHFCGKTDYNNPGKKDCPAYITWELRETGKGLEFSAQAEIWQANKQDIYCGGQCVDTVAALFPGDKRAQEIKTVWEAWHLNGMRANCQHQTGPDWNTSEEITLYYFRLSETARLLIQDGEKTAAACLKSGETFTPTPEQVRVANLPKDITWYAPTLPADKAPDYVPNGPQYTRDSYNKASEKKTAGWVNPSEHPRGLLSKPCPVCGYKYGNAWLHEELPTAVVEQIKSWVPEAPVTA